MKNISFTDFGQLCENSRDRKYITEIIEVIQNSVCLFHPGVVLPNKRIADLYQFRFEIAKERNKESPERLNDFKNTVAQLQKTESEFLATAILQSEIHFFFIFYEPETKIILGVLKSDSLLIDTESNIQDQLQKGLTVGFQKYFKGELIKDWP